MIETLLSIAFVLIVLAYLVSLGTVRFTKGGGAGIVWVGLGLFIQWRYWEINHAPYVPLLMPSPFIIVAFVFTAGGIWLFARTRTIGAWKWALLALVPVVGPLFSGLRLLLMPVIRPRRPSFGSLAFTVLPGLILYFCIQLQGLYQPRDQAIESPNQEARVLITSPGIVGHPAMKLEWQRLFGPFVIETRELYLDSHTLWHGKDSVPVVRWSQDSSRVLVAGIHHQIESPKPHIQIGSKPVKEAMGHYLLYDTEGDRLWCNDADRCETLSHFSDDDVGHIHWVPTLATDPTEPLELQSAHMIANDMPSRTADEHLKRGLVYLKERRYQEGMNDLDQAREMEPTRTDIYKQIDNVLTERREWDAVISMWTKLITLQPANGQAYYERGGASFHKGDMPNALKDLAQACKYNYGDSCLRLQRFAKQ